MNRGSRVRQARSCLPCFGFVSRPDTDAPTAATPAAKGDSDDDAEGRPERLMAVLAHEPELAEIVGTWTQLQEHVRRAIVKLSDAAGHAPGTYEGSSGPPQGEIFDGQTLYSRVDPHDYAASRRAQARCEAAGTNDPADFRRFYVQELTGY